LYIEVREGAAYAMLISTGSSVTTVCFQQALTDMHVILSTKVGRQLQFKIALAHEVGAEA
jgi:hypothetical protein